MHRGLTKIFFIALVASSMACGQGPSDTSSAQGADLSTGTRVCRGAFFDAHPVTTMFTDSRGAKLSIPFAACDVTLTMLKGTADYSSVAARVSASGYVPVSLAGGKTSATLFFIEFGHSDVGSYREFIVSYDIVAANPSPSAIPWVNPFSAAVPAFMPGTIAYMDRLLLQHGSGDRATRMGVETIGIDKRLGNVSVSHSGGSTHFGIEDERAEVVIDGQVADRSSPNEQLAELTKLAAALGLPNAQALPPTPEQLVLPLINEDINQPGKYWQWPAIFHHLSPVMASFGGSDALHIGTKSALGRVLSDMHFAPMVTIRYADVDAVYPPPTGWSP
jgi:hypothetical protein